MRTNQVLARSILALFVAAFFIGDADAQTRAPGTEYFLGPTLGKVWEGADSYAGVPNAQTGTTYTIVPNDSGKLVSFSNSSPVAVTLPKAGTPGFSSGRKFIFQNIGAGTATITPTTSTICGAATLALTQNTGVIAYSDGTNYLCQNTVAAGVGAGTVPSGGTGQTTLTARSVLIGEGTSAVGFAGPSATVGAALVSAGSSADPLFTTALLAPNVSSGVNQVVVTGAATGSVPSVKAGGASGDAAEAMDFGTKGTGNLRFLTDDTAVQFSVLRTASAVNNLNVTGSTSTNVVPITTTGSGATIPIGLFPKGTSTVALGGTTVANSSVQANTVASAVDFLSLNGAATANPAYPSIIGTGTDTNVGLALQTKGVASVFVGGAANANAAFEVVNPAGTIVNHLIATPSATGAAPSLTLGGSGADANRDLSVAAAGTGNVRLGGATCTVAGATPVTCNGQRGVATTGTLTTAGATAATAYVINDSSVAATDVIQCTDLGYSGTLVTNGYPWIASCVPGSGTITVNIVNTHATSALNGTVKIGFVVF
jgi:hypothetical protein